MHLHWLPVCLRIKFKIILLTYKVLHNCAPLYIKDLIDPYVPARCLRSSSHILLQQPRFNLQTYGGRAFSVASPAAPLTYFNDWGMGGGGGGRVRQRFIFYTQKNHTFRICLPKKPLLYLAFPKNPLVLFSQPPKNPSVFSSRPKKIPASFINPKRSLLAKISDPKKSKCRKQSLSCHTQRRRPSIKIIHIYLYFNFYYYSTKF